MNDNFFENGDYDDVYFEPACRPKKPLPEKHYYTDEEVKEAMSKITKKELRERYYSDYVDYRHENREANKLDGVKCIPFSLFAKWFHISNLEDSEYYYLTGIFT